MPDPATTLKLKQIMNALNPDRPPSIGAKFGGLPRVVAGLGAGITQGVSEPVPLGSNIRYNPLTQAYETQETEIIEGQVRTYWRPLTLAEQRAYEKDLAGGDGTAGRDAALGRLTEEQILNAQQERELAASEEARAAEMQPYDIAESQSNVEYEKRTADVAEKQLQRQILSDKFTRAQEIFNASYNLEQLAQEKKKTATTLLSSIVDNLVPPGMAHPPGLGNQPWPTAGQIHWNELGGGLNPETDQAVRYMQGMR